MRVIYLTEIWTILLCFPLWALFQVGATVLCLNLPGRFFSPDAFFYRTHRFERDGRLYKKIFRVHRWKHLLPDGGKVLNKKGFKKDRLKDFSEDNLKLFLMESARGEMTHWLCIFPFWIFWFFTPPMVPWMMLAYALISNIPCIIVQRYNRPRIKHFLLIRSHSRMK